MYWSLRTMTNLLAGLASLQSGYDWDMNAGQMDELDDSGDMNRWSEVACDLIRILEGIRSTAQLAKAKVFFPDCNRFVPTGVALCSPITIDWDVDDRLVRFIDQMDLEEEAEFRRSLARDRKVLWPGLIAFEEGGDRIDLEPFVCRSRWT